MAEDPQLRAFAKSLFEPPAASGPSAEGDASEPGSTARPVEMLTIRFPNGDAQAFAYSFLHPLELKQGEVIAHFVTHVVTLRGHNLSALFERLRRKALEMITLRDALHAAAGSEPWAVTEADVRERPQPPAS
jgi:hypothetical protein